MGISDLNEKNTGEEVLKSSSYLNSNRVDLNNLIKKVREEEKKNKRNSVYVSAAAISAVAVFGIILTL
tara:strand:- start:455 stop:658 length:204 start_codon:yes stop_codon:yes gene_type:complete